MDSKKRITFISDTHNRHNLITDFLPGGDLLIHAGDFMNSGYNPMEAIMFFKWFDEIENYDTKVFIAGNHDRWMQDASVEAKGMLTGYKNIDYLQDERMELWDGEDQQLVIYGTPWQPEFHNWAFNLPRGEKLKEKWDMIPVDVDILITHSPPFGKLDFVNYDRINVGCDELLKKIEEIKPKINVFGHIHEGFGYVFDGHTHFINASVLNERYEFRNKPVNVIWDSETNELEFV